MIEVRARALKKEKHCVNRRYSWPNFFSQLRVHSNGRLKQVAAARTRDILLPPDYDGKLMIRTCV